MFNNQMTPEEIIKAWQSQARSDLEAARSMRNHWQREVERLERQVDSLNAPEVATEPQKAPSTQSSSSWLGLETLDGYNG